MCVAYAPISDCNMKKLIRCESRKASIHWTCGHDKNLKGYQLYDEVIKSYQTGCDF